MLNARSAVPLQAAIFHPVVEMALFAKSAAYLLGSFFLFVSLTCNLGQPWTISFRKRMAAVHGLLLGIFLFISAYLDVVRHVFGKGFFSTVWYALAAGVVLSGIAILIRWGDFLRAAAARPVEAVFLSGAGTVSFMMGAAAPFLWSFMAAPTTTAVRLLLRFFGLDVGLSSGPCQVEHPLFQVAITPACSGLEGISLFSVVFFVILALDWRCYKPWEAAGLFFTGILYAVFMNIVRIAFFFALAVEAVHRTGNPKAASSAIEMFHSHVGWGLYLVGISLFFWVHFRFKKKQTGSISS